MTVVIGVDCGAEILMLADTRVSYGAGGNCAPKDQLVKLIGVTFADREAVLGFSGNILYIKSILESLRIRAKHYRSSGSLREDFRKWIVEIIRMKHPMHHVQLMLCDFDPADTARIHLYDVKASGDVQLKPQNTVDIVDRGGQRGRGIVAVIGSGSRLKPMIYEAALGSFGDPDKYDSFDAYSRVRMLMIEALAASEFEAAGSADVGGPFAIARLRPNGLIGPSFTWPYGGGDSSDVQFTVQGSKNVLWKPSTDERYTLYSIFDYGGADFANNPGASAL